MGRTYEIISFPTRDELTDALLSERSNAERPAAIFRVVCMHDYALREAAVGMTINRIKRLEPAVWQFTGVIQYYTCDTGGDVHKTEKGTLYAGGEFSSRDGRIVHAPTTKNLIVLTEQEFRVFQR